MLCFATGLSGRFHHRLSLWSWIGYFRVPVKLFRNQVSTLLNHRGNPIPRFSCFRNLGTTWAQQIAELGGNPPIIFAHTMRVAL